MNITTSKFYSANGGSVDNNYKDFIFTYTEEILKSETNKWMMSKIIDKTKKLKSSTSSKSDDIALDFIEGAVYLEPDDYVFNILNHYFNSRGDLNTKKAGLILLYINGFLAEHLTELSIGDNLLTEDNVPIIDVLKKEIDQTNVELGEQLENLYKEEPIIREANINIRYLYLNTRINKAFTLLKSALKKKNYDNNKFQLEYDKITGKMVTARNLYLDSKNHKSRMSAKYIIEKYNIMRYKTFANSGGSASKFRATLRGLIPNDKFYLLNSNYACSCGID